MTKDQLEVLFETWRKGATPKPDTHAAEIPQLSESGRRLVAAKNMATNNRYNDITHILQNLTYAMQEEGHTLAHQLPPHLIASVVWHVPNNHLIEETYFDAVKDSILYLHSYTRTKERCAAWTDIMTGERLFSDTSDWRREDVHTYLVEAWQCLGFSKTFLG